MAKVLIVKYDKDQTKILNIYINSLINSQPENYGRYVFLCQIKSMVDDTFLL